MKVSVVVPSKGGYYLKYLLPSLNNQSLKPDEVILILKNCNLRDIEALCNQYTLNCVIIEQKRGYYTSALNLGKREASGEVIIFTDDDAIPPRRWVKRYVKIWKKALYNIGSISSRDFYIRLNGLRVVPTKDDAIETRIYRWFVRPCLEPPLSVLKKYRFGVYIDKRLNVVHGPFLPYKACFSLPYRGVNMSFRKEAINEADFPVHPSLKRGFGNEQYVGLQLVLKKWELVYTPSNPTLHIQRKESLSRIATKVQRAELKYETSIMRGLFNNLLLRGIAEGFKE
ncbi:MAG: glycosyltransferase family 2 protein [Candidatus Nezhaarchaeota archaeon]|nr:glycosyltransferase family 2 protein [Candidatus Nezhaarchaeota archaeon]